MNMISASKNELKAPEQNGNEMVASKSELFVGPLPHPDLFERYEQVLPGLGDRIAKMAEINQKNRIEMERRISLFEGLEKIGGLICAFIIVLVSIFGGIYLILHDKSISGLVSGAVPLATIGGLFYYQKKQEKSVQE